MVAAEDVVVLVLVAIAGVVAVAVMVVVVDFVADVDVNVPMDVDVDVSGFLSRNISIGIDSRFFSVLVPMNENFTKKYSGFGESATILPSMPTYAA